MLVRLCSVVARRRGVLPLELVRLRSRRLYQTTVLLVLVAAGIPQVGDALGPRVAEVLATLRLEAATPVEAAMAVQGYYEQLADTHMQASPLRDCPASPPRKGRISERLPVYTGHDAAGR